MSERPVPSDDLSNPGLPLGVSEGDLLALIEGLPMPAERAGVVRGAIARDARLGGLLAQMRADRAELAGLVGVKPPADLLERVEAQLEREALVGLARGEADAAAGQIVRIVRPSTPIAQRAWFRLTAVAAVLAVVAGSGFLIWQGDRSARQQRLLALKNNTSVLNPVDPKLLELGPDESPGGAQGTMLASGSTSPSSGLQGDVPPARPVIAPARALELAHQGRLLIRVRATNIEQAVARLENQANRNMEWCALSKMSEVAMSVASGGLAQAEAHARGVRVKPVFVAQESKGSPNVAPGAPAHLPLVIAPTAYSASVQGTPEALEKVLHMLTGESMSADFVELLVPMPGDLATDGESVLWWLNAPATWGQRVSAPVLVEQR